MQDVEGHEDRGDCGGDHDVWVSVDIEVESGYVLEEAAMWIGKDKLPQKNHRYTSSPDDFPFKTGRDGVHTLQDSVATSFRVAVLRDVRRGVRDGGTRRRLPPRPTPIPTTNAA